MVQMTVSLNGLLGTYRAGVSTYLIAFGFAIGSVVVRECSDRFLHVSQLIRWVGAIAEWIYSVTLLRIRPCCMTFLFFRNVSK